MQPDLAVDEGQPVSAALGAMIAYERVVRLASEPEVTPAMVVSMDADIDEQFERARAASRPKPSVTLEGDRGWHPVL